MIEVVCDDCQTVQQVDVTGTPRCRACGAETLTATTGYDPAPP